ncbi:RNase adapter RapZ [Demequina capsici]|uniref:RNase adapter RapZ n=1 Tax=Demequina capsici TaxID=3075620 RepID=A0AA96F9D2_9MICO|nr:MULTISPECIES: RNase adapter RapZ [unclassified Demequina]WNM25929.1 RNase adapter RapZ [Demequina sp. OYTSA14]WNM26034.1 RNase adapter RapZ [Demequina sp. PMTSA13]
MTDDPAPETYPSGLPRPDLSGMQRDSRVLIVTGMSGAGRTRAAAVLSDLGWYVVDNLPPQMLGSLVAMVATDPTRRLATVVDVRGGGYFSDLEAVIDDLEARGVDVRLLFLDASDETLVRRFEEARRPHPLQRDATILEGIAREREAVAAARGRADLVIDTSRLNVHQLRDVVTEEFADEAPRLHVNVLSFGFKNGAPVDADYVADVRFLRNPHWVPELRPLTGLDPAVREHVLESDGAQEFLAGYARVLDIALAGYRAHDKHSVTIAVGCTGGRHRSVAMAEELSAQLKARGYDVRTTHRDKDR